MRIFRRLLAAGIAAIGSLLLALFIERSTPVTLPPPTGRFAVGRTLFDWKDQNTVDVLAPVPGRTRELLVWIWYPAQAARDGAGADTYVPAAVRSLATYLEPAPIFKLLSRDSSRVHGHSIEDAAIARGQRSYPVVIFRAGASAEVLNYSTLTEDLASHGYVVVGFDAPYRTMAVVFPDGRVYERTPENNPELYSGAELTRVANKLLTAWTGDVGFVLHRLAGLNAAEPSGRFTGSLDMAHVGVFGHSFGGATAAQFCSQDSRCTAGIDIDGSLHGDVLRTGIQRPFLFLMSGHGDLSSDAEARQVMADIRSVYDRLPENDRLMVSIRGANHFTFSDDGAFRKSHLLRAVLRIAGQLGIDPRRQVEITAYCVHRFFDAYLKRTGTRPQQIASPLYPELRVLTKAAAAHSTVAAGLPPRK